MVFWKIHISITFCKLDRKIIPDDLLKLQNNLPNFPALLTVFPSFFFLSSQKSFISEHFESKIYWRKHLVHSPSFSEKLFNGVEFLHIYTRLICFVGIPISSPLNFSVFLSKKIRRKILYEYTPLLFREQLFNGIVKRPD